MSDELVGPLFKGFPKSAPEMPIAAVGYMGWKALAGDLPLPIAVLRASALAGNSLWMRAFLDLTGVALCPHGKTTMSPQLHRRQIEDGAWGITVANVNQLQVCRSHGIERVFMANQLIDRAAIAYVVDELSADPRFDFYCLVDSVAGVERLETVARERGLDRSLRVLLEGGFRGGRTGCRDRAAARAVAEAVGAAKHLDLSGIEGYEGIVTGATREQRDGRIRSFLDYLVHLLRAGLEEDWFATDPVLLTAGGSSYFDMVADTFGAGAGSVKIVLRSGCYLTHDAGLYQGHFREMLARSEDARGIPGRFEPALEVWGVVQSMPEVGLAIANVGKRDVSHDVDLPKVIKYCRDGGSVQVLAEAYPVSRLNDQHAYVSLPPESPLAIGDFVGFAIFHPCTTFDKWRLIYVVDDDYRVEDAVCTYF